MALVMKQKASVSWFDIDFGLNLSRFIEQLCSKKRSIPSLSISIMNLTEEWQLLRVTRKLSADNLSGIIVKVSSTYLLQ